MDVLRESISLDDVKKALKSLPKTLDETYERILQRIPENRSSDALRILQWLIFSARPLRVEEVAELLVSNPDMKNCEFNVERRPFNPKDIVTYCGSLVTVQGSSGAQETLRLAHFSVQEFLVSDRIIASRCAYYSVVRQSANILIARTCLIYLTEIHKQKLSVKDMVRVFSLAKYAASYWAAHIRAAEVAENDDIYKQTVCFLECERARYNWIQLLQPYRSWEGHNIAQKSRLGSPPLYYASMLGLNESVKILLKKGADVNAQRGYYGNALQAASGEGREAVVQLLLEKGADVNAQGGKYGNALQAASSDGHEAVVQLLLEKGADVNAHGGDYGNALQAASWGGHEAVVQLLLEKGADVNAQDGYYGNALRAASSGGHEAVVQLLLEKGADVNVQGGKYGNALHAASSGGHEAVVQLLLEKGADVNAQGGYYGNPLQAASWRGHEAVVQLLLEKGADVNAHGGDYGNALQAASWEGHEAVVQLLLEKGADVNAQVGYYGNPLLAASWGGYEAVVQLLLEKGADVNAQGGWYSNALQVLNGEATIG